MSESCPHCQEWRNDCNTHLERIRELEQSIARLCIMANELTALRQRIANAPVVAWMSPGKERLEFSRQDTVYGSHTIPLISKEDLL